MPKEITSSSPGRHTRVTSMTAGRAACPGENADSQGHRAGACFDRESCRRDVGDAGRLAERQAISADPRGDKEVDAEGAVGVPGVDRVGEAGWYLQAGRGIAGERAVVGREVVLVGA